MNVEELIQKEVKILGKDENPNRATQIAEIERKTGVIFVAYVAGIRRGEQEDYLTLGNGSVHHESRYFLEGTWNILPGDIARYEVLKKFE